jgi:predicted outer membrane protein
MGRQAIRRRETLRGVWGVVVSMVATVFLLGSGVAGAQGEPSPVTTDQSIVIKLQRIDEMLMAAGRLAYTRGTLPAVRDFGAALVRDYQGANTRLLTYAGETKVDMNQSPLQSAADADLDRGERALMETLRRAPAGEFDYRFAKAMQQIHLRAITTVADARHRVRDQNLNRLLEDVLITLRTHEQFSTNLINETQPVFRLLGDEPSARP